MGQRIEVDRTVVVGASAVFTTDRGLTGMAGFGFDGAEEASSANGFAASLALQIFEADEAVGRVFIAANEVVVDRSEGWDEPAVSITGEVIGEFFLHYGPS